MEEVKENSPETLRLGGTAKETVSIFGPLEGLIGTWVGLKGWNLIAVPQQFRDKPDAIKDAFTLLVAPYVETLTITPLSSPTPNRGEEIIQQVPTLMYTLSINDAANGSLLHAENGTWLGIPNDPSGFTVARLGSIPHGDTILALGNVTVTDGPPVIPDVDTIPNTNNDPTKMLGYKDPYNVQVPGLISKKNPNLNLRKEIANQTILKTTTIHVSTANQGNVANIPFIQKNANVSKFEATFWIETVLNEETQETFQQLQYSQTAVIDFFPLYKKPGKLIEWPHVNINTMIKN